MNFQDLYKKIAALDEGAVEECGAMPSSIMGSKQPDSVTMNVNMSGSGAGGIKDLMDIIRSIESGDAGHGHDHDAHAEPLIGDEFEEEYANEPNEETLDTDAVVNIGMPINAGDHRDDRQAGPLPVGKPMDESLVNRLSQMYQQIKTSN